MKSPERQDLAVIMARGSSRRMGRAKGLCRVPSLARPFLPTLVELFSDRDLPVLIVTNRTDLAAYRELVAADADVLWCTAASDGDTARTARLAQATCPGFSHYWLHPVDVPLLRPDTLAILKKESTLAPDHIVRPICSRQPGHPVIVPDQVLTELLRFSRETDVANQSATSTGPLRDLITAAVAGGVIAPALTIPVTDAGTIIDHDTPGDLRSALRTRKEGDHGQ